MFPRKYLYFLTATSLSCFENQPMIIWLLDISGSLFVLSGRWMSSIVLREVDANPSGQVTALLKGL